MEVALSASSSSGSLWLTHSVVVCPHSPLAAVHILRLGVRPFLPFGGSSFSPSRGRFTPGGLGCCVVGWLGVVWWCVGLGVVGGWARVVWRVSWCEKFSICLCYAGVSYAVVFSELFTKCAHLVRTRTDAALDQDCVLKATMQACASLWTTCVNFQHSSLSRKLHLFRARFATQTRK